MNQIEARAVITKNLLNIIDVLREYPDEYIDSLCSDSLRYLKALEENEKRKGEDYSYT